VRAESREKTVAFGGAREGARVCAAERSVSCLREQVVETVTERGGCDGHGQGEKSPGATDSTEHPENCCGTIMEAGFVEQDEGVELGVG
jgi:hypothetical protein